MNIRVTEEMRREVAYWRLACAEHADAETEAHALFWERKMARHQANLMSLIDSRLGDIALPGQSRAVIFTRQTEEL